MTFGKRLRFKSEYLTFNMNIGLPSASDSPLAGAACLECTRTSVSPEYMMYAAM